MFYIGIDLAERHSAAVVMGDDYQARYEDAIDSGPVAKQEHPYPRIHTYRSWVNQLLSVAQDYNWLAGAQFVIEEPYPHAVNVAPSFRIQGSLLAELQSAGVPEENVRVTKSKPWQDHFGYTKKEFGNPKAWAKLMCEGFGYEPGETVETKFKVKPKEDLRDAYLLARWLKETS